MRYRRLVICFVIFLLVFVGMNYGIWKTVTEDLLTSRHSDGGDLSRMGYLPGSKLPRRNGFTLPARHLELREYDGRPLDLVVIGDSFSNGGGGGTNRFYQDYFASRFAFQVLNVNPLGGLDFISHAAILANNGFLAKARPRYLLIGATESDWREWTQPVDFGQKASMSELAGLPPRIGIGKLPEVSFMNNGNLKFLLFSALYRFSDHALFSKVYRAELTKPMFSAQDSARLLYLPYDKLPGRPEVERVNRNLNELSDRLAASGVRLIFMPFPNKYTLYAPWIEKRRYPESSFFEYLRPMEKRYLFVDTKALLRGALARGEKDVYYPDDTHSSWKASKMIVEDAGLNAELSAKPLKQPSGR